MTDFVIITYTLREQNNTITCKIGALLYMEYLPILRDKEFIAQEGTSLTRIGIVERIRREQYCRPAYNIERNASLSKESKSNIFVPLDQNGKPMEIEFFNPK